MGIYIVKTYTYRDSHGVNLYGIPICKSESIIKVIAKHK
jgi:hypothetical protein